MTPFEEYTPRIWLPFTIPQIEAFIQFSKIPPTVMELAYDKLENHRVLEEMAKVRDYVKLDDLDLEIEI